MITIRGIVEAMEAWAPVSLAESWDNSGLLIGAPGDPVSALLLALDVTERTIDTACSAGASLIISHHPPLFRPLSRLTGSHPSVRVVRKAIRENVAVYTAHTNLDQVPGGVSHALADRLGLRNVSILSPGSSGLMKFVTFAPPECTDRIREAAGAAGAGVIGEYTQCSFTVHGVGTYLPSEAARPFAGESGHLSRVGEDRIEMILPSPLAPRGVAAVREAHPYEEMAHDLIPLSNPGSPYGYGVVGDLAEPMGGREFLRYIAGALHIEALTASADAGRPIRRVAVMGGSGGKFIGQAVAAGADAFVTGDLGHHDYQDASGSILLVDATHRATELPVLWNIERELHARLSENVTIHIDSGEVEPLTRVYTYYFSADIDCATEEGNESGSHEDSGSSGN
jgi:dinuclear metal center YbgI/SA1388 family protein